MTEPVGSTGRDDSGVPGDSTRGVARWLKLGVVTAALAVLVVVIVLLSIGGEHGPGRHAPGESGDQPTPAGVSGAHRPPSGGHG